MPTNWGARSFNGTTDWYSTVTKQNPQSAVAYSCWINPTALTQQVIIAAASFGSANTVYSQFFIVNPGGIAARIALSVSTFIGRDSNSNILSSGVWQHAAFTWNGGTTAAAIKVYLNGTQVDTTDDNAGSFSAPASNSVPIYIGAQSTGTVGAPVWNAGYGGSISDVAVWSVALSGSEISSLSRGARPGQIRPNSLFCWIPLGGLTTVEPDLSGTANNATIITGGPASVFGPPYTPFTPRWPQANNAIIPVVAGFKAQFARGKNVVVEGVAT